MTQLKEIKSRLKSIRSIEKITSAMMMISSARLHRTQSLIGNLLNYQKYLSHFLSLLVIDGPAFPDSLICERPLKKIVIIPFSSNGGLIGRFNRNIDDRLTKRVEELRATAQKTGQPLDIIVYPFGEKIAKTAKALELDIPKDYSELIHKSSYSKTRTLALQLMKQFQNKEIDRVELLYHHFIAKGVQEIICEPFLPFPFEQKTRSKTGCGEKGGSGKLRSLHKEATDYGQPQSLHKEATDHGQPQSFEKLTDTQINAQVFDQEFPTEYILEPDQETLINLLVPKVLEVKLFSTLLDSLTSEHAARVIAMQTATENADELTDELNTEYNKLRQESITNELLDIMGGRTS